MCYHKKNIDFHFQAAKILRTAGFINLLILSCCSSVFTQAGEWKIKKIDDGKITVKYKISDRIDENGNKATLIEDFSATTDSLSLQKCIMFMKDISKYKEFTGNKISKNIKAPSENEWLVYYYSNNP